MTLRIDDIVAAVTRHSPRAISRLTAPRRAAVAALIREGELGPEVLLMQRSERRGDRWSGQVALPGGREQTEDRDLVATAMRETREEVAVDLERQADLVGGLDAVRARGRGGLTNMSVWPYVFVATGEVAPRRSPEAADVFWLPLEPASRGELNSIYTYRYGPLPLELPCWRYSGHVVWGMTYRMLEGFLELLR